MASSDNLTKEEVEKYGFVWIPGEPVSKRVRDAIKILKQRQGTVDKSTRKSISVPKPKPFDKRLSSIDKEDRKTSLSAARNAGHLYYWKNGKKMAAVTREDLKGSGLGLRDYMNKQLGKTRRKPKVPSVPKSRPKEVERVNLRKGGLIKKNTRP